MTYTQRLEYLDLPSLWHRRLRGETTLTVWDLWTDPVGVAALLDVWGEKLGGPRAGV